MELLEKLRALRRKNKKRKGTEIKEMSDTQHILMSPNNHESEPHENSMNLGETRGNACFRQIHAVFGTSTGKHLLQKRSCWN